MQYLSSISPVDGFSLALLCFVLACGAYDHWLQHK